MWADEGSDEALALALQRAQPGDPRIYAALLERYGAELRRLVAALLAEPAWEEPPAEAVLRLVQKALVTATASADQFWGEASVRGWLFRQAIHQVQFYYRKQRARQLLQRKEDAPQGSPGVPTLESWLWERLEKLPSRERSVVLLHFLFDLTGAEIALAAQTSQERIFRLLSDLRLSQPVGEQGSAPANPSHFHLRQQVRAAHDGGLSGDPAALGELRDHLATCPDCRAYAAWLDTQDKTITQALDERWPVRQLSAQELGALDVPPGDRLEAPSQAGRIGSLARYGLWIGLAVAFFVAAAWYLNQSLPQEKPPDIRSTSTPTQLPPPIEISPILQARAGAERDQVGVALNLDPHLSADGSQVLFFSAGIPLVPNQEENEPGIYLYDREKQAFSHLGSAVGWDTIDIYQSQGMSADGRWVVYNAPTQDPGGAAAETSAPGKGILLLDRLSGQTERIDRAPDGSPADGDSFFPVISADGGWIAYWSTAYNLVPDSAGGCPQAVFLYSCLDLYLYDRQGQETRRLPVGRSFSTPSLGDLISLSGDGRRLALTLFADDEIAAPMQFLHLSDAYVYDWQTGELIALNQLSDGTSGNDASFAPTISADGRYVAFSSWASNLVSGDTNANQDVFGRDLESGAIERLSIGSGGAQADSSSGSIGYSRSGWAEKVSVSGDGRMALFTSAAVNLADLPPGTCLPSKGGRCNVMYVHDRQTGRTERIAGPLEGRVYLFGSLSADGRWVVYTEYWLECWIPAGHACAEIWLHDRQTGWTGPVTKALGNFPEHPWSVANQMYWRGGGEPAMAYSPDGSLIAAAGVDGVVRLWRLPDAIPITSLRASPETEISSLAFSPDGRFLAAGAAPGAVKIWDLEEATLAATLEGPAGVIHSLTYSAGGNRLAAGTDQAVWVWEIGAEESTRLAAMEYPAGFVKEAVLAPDGGWLAVAASDNTVWIQAVPAGQVLLRLGNPRGRLLTLAVSPDGMLLATASDSGAVNLWDVESLGQAQQRQSAHPSARYLRTLQHQDQVEKIVFSRNGKGLVSLAEDGRLRFWHVPEGAYQGTIMGDQVDGALDFALSPTGNDIVVNQGQSSILRLSRGGEQVAAPRFFTRTAGDNLLVPVANSPDPFSDEALALMQRYPIEEPLLPLQTSVRQATFNARVPAYLPPGLVFRGAILTQEGALIYQYDYVPAPGSASRAGLMLCQRPLVAETSRCDVKIGASAAVERVEVERMPGEYVSGDWPFSQGGQATSQDTSKVAFTWDAEAPGRWLRWSYWGNVNMIYTWAYPDVNLPIFQDDLLAIAESMLPLGEAFTPSPIVLDYIVQEGDSCAQLLWRFNTTIGALAELNATNPCPLVQPGGRLRVPLPQTRLPLKETDLNCDGQTERVQAIPVEDERERGVVFGVMVDRMGWDGSYRSAWQHTVVEVGGGVFTIPELFTVGGCEQFLALNERGGEAGGVRFKVFRWDGESMHTVLDVAGEADAGIFPVGPLAVISARVGVVDPASETCQQVRTFYAWDGRAYVEAVQETEVVDCEAAGRLPPKP